MHEIRGPKLLTKGRNQSFERRRADARYRADLEEEMAKNPPDVPLDMVVTMFKQRMQAIMMQDRKRLRHVFETYDTAKSGQLSLDQFHAALVELAGTEISIDRKLASQLMKRFSVMPGFILYAEFVQNFLGLPPDFFSMKLVDDNAQASNNAAGRDNKKKQSSVFEFKRGTNMDKVAKVFVHRMRKRLLNTKAAMNVALHRPGDGCTHLNEDELWYLLREQGTMVNKKDLRNVMEHLDRDCDGKLHYEELANELLGLPKPSEVKHIKPWKEKRPALSDRTLALVHKLAVQCERAAATPVTLKNMFQSFDKDGSGCISYDEFQAMVQEFGCEVEGVDAAAALLAKFDADGAGELSYTEFITDVLGLQPNALQKNPNDADARPSTPEIMQKLTGSLKKKIMANPEAIKKAFKMFDKSGDGTLTLDEYRMGIEALGMPITRAQIRKMFCQHTGGDIDAEIQTKDFACDVLGLTRNIDEDNNRPHTSMSQLGTTGRLGATGSLGNTMSSLGSTMRSLGSTGRMVFGQPAAAGNRTPPMPRPSFRAPSTGSIRRAKQHVPQGGAPCMPTEFLQGGATTRREPRMNRVPPIGQKQGGSISQVLASARVTERSVRSNSSFMQPASV